MGSGQSETMEAWWVSNDSPSQPNHNLRRLKTKPQDGLTGGSSTCLGLPSPRRLPCPAQAVPPRNPPPTVDEASMESSQSFIKARQVWCISLLPAFPPPPAQISPKDTQTQEKRDDFYSCFFQAWAAAWILAREQEARGSGKSRVQEPRGSRKSCHQDVRSGTRSRKSFGLAQNGRFDEPALLVIDAKRKTRDCSSAILARQVATLLDACILWKLSNIANIFTLPSLLEMA
jgi:hypothetical protein